MNKEQLIEKLNLMKALERVKLNGEYYDNCLIVFRNYDKWEVFFFERGNRYYEKVFFNEADAYRYVYDIIFNDYQYAYKNGSNWGGTQILKEDYDKTISLLKNNPDDLPLSYLNAINDPAYHNPKMTKEEFDNFVNDCLQKNQK